MELSLVEPLHSFVRVPRRLVYLWQEANHRGKNPARQANDKNDDEQPPSLAISGSKHHPREGKDSRKDPGARCNVVRLLPSRAHILPLCFSVYVI